MIRVLIVLSFCSAASAAVTNAWWVTAEFPVSGEEVFGVPVEAIDSTWIQARVLTLDDVPESYDGYNPSDWLKGSGFDFQIEDDIDGDGDVESAVVAVFETQTGERGTALIIFGPNRTVELLWNARTKKAGFGVIQKSDSGLRFAYCLNCGSLVDFEVVSPDHYREIG